MHPECIETYDPDAFLLVEFGYDWRAQVARTAQAFPSLDVSRPCACVPPWPARSTFPSPTSSASPPAQVS